MKEYIDLSVVIPCYNVEPYIEQCLESIVTQDILPREIILIDDGSTDKSAEKIKNYIKNYPNIFYYYQMNQGVGAARNLGLSRSKSTFIQFLDPDDLIDSSFYQIIQSFFENKINADLLYFNYQPFKNNYVDSQKTHSLPISIVKIGPGNKLLNYLLEHNGYTGVCWRYLFRKNLFVHRFDGRVHEDHLFSLQLLLSAKETYYLQSNIYYYRIRESSLSHRTKSAEYVDVFYSVLKKCLELINYSQIDEKNKQKYRISMMTYYLSTVFSCEERKDDSLKLIYGCYELMYRIYILKKTGFIKNLFFIQKLSKKVKFSYTDIIKLIKYLYTGRYPKCIYEFDTTLILQ